MAGPNSLENLPPELLCMVLEYTLPNGLSFKFEKYLTTTDAEPQWMVLAQPIDSKDATFSLVVRRIVPPRWIMMPQPTLWARTSQMVKRRAPDPHALKNLTTSRLLPCGILDPFVALSSVNKQFHAEAKGAFPSSRPLLPPPTQLTHPSHPLRAQPIHPNNRRPITLPYLPLLAPNLRAPRPPAPHPPAARLAQDPPRPRHQ